MEREKEEKEELLVSHRTLKNQKGGGAEPEEQN